MASHRKQLWVELLGWLFKLSLISPVVGWSAVALIQLRGGWKLVVDKVAELYVPTTADECSYIVQSAAAQESFFNLLLASTWACLALFACHRFALRRTGLSVPRLHSAFEGWRRTAKIIGTVGLGLASVPAAVGWSVVFFRFLENGRGWVNVHWAIGDACDGWLQLPIGDDCAYWQWQEGCDQVFFDELFHWTWVAVAAYLLFGVSMKTLRRSMKPRYTDLP